MIKTLIASFACALAFAAAPAWAYEQNDFLGRWTCAAGPLEVTTTYTPDGRFHSVGVMTAQPTQQGALDLGMQVRGAWTVEGDQLTETGDAYDIDFVRLDGATVDPSSEVYLNMTAGMDAMLGTSNVRTVLAVDDASYTVTYEGSPPLTCTR